MAPVLHTRFKSCGTLKKKECIVLSLAKAMMVNTGEFGDSPVQPINAIDVLFAGYAISCYLRDTGREVTRLEECIIRV